MTVAPSVLIVPALVGGAVIVGVPQCEKYR